MRARFEKIPLESGASFSCREFRVRRFEAPWHFHPELELTWIVNGRGLRFVGDSIAPFETGDLVLLGPNVPHFWSSDAAPDAAALAHSVVVQWEAHFLGAEFFQAPEMRAVAQGWTRAGRGLQVMGRTRERVAAQLEELLGAQGLARLLALLRIWDDLARSDELRPLSSPGFSPSLSDFDAERINTVCRLVRERLGAPLAQPEAAAAVCLTPAAFSRFFKSKTGKTFAAFVNEVRIGQACRLLVEGRRAVGEIADECGFSNLSNFNRRFRDITGASPREYRRRFGPVD